MPSHHESKPPASMKAKPGTKLGLAAPIVALAFFFGWFAMNNAVGVPENRTFFVLGWLLAIALGLGAFVRGTRWYGGIAAALGIFIGTFLPMTVYISPQQVGAGAVQVGDTIPQFKAVDEFGEWFDSEALQGHHVLIKFFRAHW